MVEDSQAPVGLHFAQRPGHQAYAQLPWSGRQLCAREADVPPTAERRDGTWSLKGADWVLWGICPLPPRLQALDDLEEVLPEAVL